MILKSSLSGNYTVTTTLADIENSSTGQKMQITILEDGLYLIAGIIAGYANDSDGTTGSLWVKLAINGNEILASGGCLRHVDSVNGRVNRAPIPINNLLSLKSGDVVTVQADMDSGFNSLVLATDEQYATYIEAINLTKLARGGM